MTPTAPAGTAAPSSGNRPAGRARLLLVDDDALNREIALDQLDCLGLTADIAENGQQAVEMAVATAYDLILMDLHMPVMDGLEATRRILALPGRRMTPIVAMTANALADCRETCLASGMVDYLSKPVDLLLLLRTLARWLPVDRGGEAVAVEADAMRTDPLTRLAALPGFDIALGMSAIGGRADKYAILLRKYREVHGASVDAIRAALAANDLSLARRLAHTLKGTAATLGLNATRDAALLLERAIADNGDNGQITLLCQQLAAVHEQQLDSLRDLLDPPPAT